MTTQIPTISRYPLARKLGVGLLALVLASASEAAQAVSEGSAAPEIELTDLKSQPVKLSNYKGKVVYLDFWASWCQPCRKTFPWMNEMIKKYGKDGLEVIAINLDQKRADADKFLAKYPANFTVLMDPQAGSAQLYDVKSMPSSYLVDRSGNVHFVHLGFKDGQQAELEGRIRGALAAAKN